MKNLKAIPIVLALLSICAAQAKQICCDATTNATVSVNEDGTTIETNGPDIDQNFDGSATAASNAASNSLNCLYFVVNYTGGTAKIKGQTKNWDQCCNKKAMSFTKWKNVQSTITLPSGSIGFFASPSLYKGILSAEATLSLTSSPGSASLIYEESCSPGAPGDRGYTTFTLHYNDIPIEGTVQVQVKLKTGYRFIGTASATGTATLKAKAVAKFLTSLTPPGPSTSLTFQGISTKSATLTLAAGVEIESFFGDWKPDPISTTFTLI